MEAATGFEPVIRVLQTHALPLGYAAVYVRFPLSGKGTVLTLPQAATAVYPHEHQPNNNRTQRNIPPHWWHVNGADILRALASRLILCGEGTGMDYLLAILLPQSQGC